MEVRGAGRVLTDAQAAAYTAYDGAPSRTESERLIFLDDADRELIEGKRRSHDRLGFATSSRPRKFAEAEAELRVWVDARAWTTGEGPKTLFDAAVGWLVSGGCCCLA